MLRAALPALDFGAAFPALHLVQLGPSHFGAFVQLGPVLLEGGARTSPDEALEALVDYIAREGGGLYREHVRRIN